jgi:diguanylate cyclase (GGDEF)-like protein
VTVSVGVATHVRPEDTGALLARADKALYQAKAAGRNQVMALG